MNSNRTVKEIQLNQNNLHTDYKAEVLALNLMKYYDDVDEIFLKRQGGGNRSFLKDIQSITSQEYELGEQVISINTCREGIYDYLPEGLFHPPSLGSYRSRVDDIVAAIRDQKKIESNARKFFQPFELEACYLELNALLLEREYDITGSSNLLLETIDELWPLLRALEKDTARIFIYLLPFFHSARASRRWLEKCLMAFLQVPVHITFVPNRVSDIDEVSTPLVLSGFELGISTLLTGSHLDGERNWALHYGPIPYDQLHLYVPGSQLRKLLHIIYDYCLPATVKAEEHFVTQKTTSSFSLYRDADNSRLGFSTFL